MSIIRQLTEAEADQKWLDDLILRKAEAMHHLASVSSSVNNEFWAISTSRLLAILNADVVRSISILQNDLDVNVPINAGLNALALPQFSARAPTASGRAGITFNGTQFVYIAPPEPTPTP